MMGKLVWVQARLAQSRCLTRPHACAMYVVDADMGHSDSHDLAWSIHVHGSADGGVT